MNYFNAIESLPGFGGPSDAFNGRFIHTGNLTVSYWEIKAGFVIPEHQHVHEGVATILEGEVEMTVNGETRVLTAGMTAFVPSNVLHSGKVISDCKMMDIFYPEREDYKALVAN